MIHPASRELHRPTIDMLFYDALSGEFYPQSDELERAHNLGRLAFSASQHGESKELEAMPELVDITYSPSWARSTYARVSLHKNRLFQVEIGGLEDQEGPSLKLNNFNQRHVYIELEGTPVTNRVLVTGLSLNSLQREIAEQAEYIYSLYV